MSQLLKIGLTHGDHNGIGYEVMMKALSDRRILELFTPIIYGSSQVWSFYSELLNIELPKPYTIKHPDQAREGWLNLIEVDTREINVKVEPGLPSQRAGTLAARALKVARDHLSDEKIKAVVTAPIDKDTIQSNAFTFNGHTEFFCAPYPHDEPTMIFAADDLKVALVTMHTPLRQVAEQITSEKVGKSIVGLEQTLKQDFGLEKPRIAVLGLNPHSGENGLLGHEERDIIAPAIQQAWDSGHLVFGPFPADGYWGSGAYRSFDATLAMYHDQGLIPFKLLAIDDGVNITGGLPIIRTSPDHGTAYDIAGKGMASEVSFRNAIYQAIDICQNRHRYKEATKNPLRKEFVDRGKDNVKLDLSKSVDEE